MNRLTERKTLISGLGIIGTLACLIVFFSAPSFPTPDKLLVFLVFIFMIFNQAWDMLQKFVPFVAILIAYDSFRGIVPFLNDHVNYDFMAKFDMWMFGGILPTVWLQQWLVHGSVAWYDYVFYIFYMLHFVLPIGLAAVIFTIRKKEYWRYAATFITASFSAFFIYLLFPAAPPWMATLNGTIPHITRVSSKVFSSLGITDFPSVYNSMAPNPVAAVPSLHVGYSVLVAIFVFKLFGRKWGSLSLIYPFCIILGVVYMGEHYVFDVITGALLAYAAYTAVPYMIRWLHPRAVSTRKKARLAWVELLDEDAEHGKV
jgi:membrane-associated phospholipid phosphatase